MPNKVKCHLLLIMNKSKTVFISSNDFNVLNFKIISLYENVCLLRKNT